MPSGHRRSGPDRPPEQPTLLCAWTPAASARVVEASRWLASELDARIVLAHAFDAMSIQVPASRELAYAGVTSEDLSQLERARVAGDLEEAADALAGIAYTTVLAEGPPVSVLQALAAEHQAYLLVTGTAAHGALDRILIGSVSSELAHSAGCPVVVVPDDAALAGTGPVVAAYDGSPDSLRAARHGAALAVRLGRELVLVHVAAPDADDARADAQLSRELNDALAVIRPAPLNASIAIANGDPAERLSELAHERGAALLVLGTRGRGAVTSALLGSVSAAVVRRGGQPTVLVGPEAESWRA
jgi:nucleotide-binding universal stress UspA family protein